MTVGVLIEKLKELDADDMEVQAPGPPPHIPKEWFTGGIIDVVKATGVDSTIVMLIPDVSG